MQQDQLLALGQPAAAILPEVKATPTILSTMALLDWRGSATTFAGFTGTTPVKEFGDATWPMISGLLAPTEPAILVDKKLGQYLVPCMLQPHELVGNTLDTAIKNNLPTIGKMRSKSHVTDASLLIMDVDGLSKDELNSGIFKLINDGITYTAYTTHSQGRVDKPDMRVRIALPLDRAVNLAEYTAAWYGVDQHYFNGKAGEADASGANMYQQQGTWCAHPDRITEAKVLRKEAGVAVADVLIAIGVEILAARGINAKSVNLSTPEQQLNKANGSFNTEDYPPSDANKITDACYQIRIFRDTKGANQSEPLWRDCIGVTAFCKNGEEITQDWSSGHAGYNPNETARKIAQRMLVPPTTC
jgi:hypothetical protein